MTRSKHPTKVVNGYVHVKQPPVTREMVWCSFHAQWKWCFLNWLVNSTDSGFSAVHLQEENDMTSKRRKLQFMLLPLNLAATYNTWLSNFVVNYKYEKFWDDHRFLSFSFYIKIGSLCLNDFLRFSGLPDKKTLFLKEGTCIISKEFAPKKTKHSKIIVWAILRTIYLTSIDWKLLSKYLFAYSYRT